MKLLLDENLSVLNILLDHQREIEFALAEEKLACVEISFSERASQGVD